jgi:tripartite-type tricarboxylate transporter receptor subunit TctC
LNDEAEEEDASGMSGLRGRSVLLERKDWHSKKNIRTGGRSMTRNMVAKAGLCLAAVVLVIGTAFGADSYPTRDIDLIVPFPPGGRSDLTVRLIKPYLEKTLKQPVVILSRPGAGGSIGAHALAVAQPDGYTIGFTTNAVVTTQYTLAGNIDLKDFTPICLVNTDPAVMAVAAAGRWKDVPSLVKYAKENPKKLLVGIDPGASAHIFAAAFLKAAKIDATLVPYKGGPDRVAALIGQHIDADFGVLAQYRSLLNADRGVRVLGVAAASRIPGYDNIPTFKESGVDLQISGWQGFFAPRGIPSDILARINAAIRDALKDPEVLGHLAKIGVNVTYLPPEEFGEFLKKDDARTKELVSELGLMVAAPK